MTLPIENDERQADFIATILQYIDEEQHDKAIKELTDIETKSNLFDVLYNLLGARELPIDITELRMNLGTISVLAGGFTREQRFFRGGGVSIDRARELAHTLILNLSNALSLASDLGDNLNLTRQIAEKLNRVLNSLASYLDYDHILDYVYDDIYDDNHNRFFVFEQDPRFSSARSSASQVASGLANSRDLVRERAGFRFDERHLSNERNLETIIIDDFRLIAQIIYHNLLEIPTLHYSMLEQVDMRYQHRLARAVDEIFYLNQQEESPVLTVIADVLLHEMQDDAIPITLEGIDSITADVLTEQIAPFMQAIQIVQEVHARITEQEFTPPRIERIHATFPRIELIGIGNIVRALNDIFSYIDGKDEKKRDDVKPTESDLMPIYKVKADEYLRKQYPDLTDKQTQREAPEIARSMILAANTGLQFRIGWHDVSRTDTPPNTILTTGAI